MSLISDIFIGLLAFLVGLWLLFRFVLPFLLGKYLKAMWDKALPDSYKCPKKQSTIVYQYLWFDDGDIF